MAVPTPTQRIVQQIDFLSLGLLLLMLGGFFWAVSEIGAFSSAAGGGFRSISSEAGLNCSDEELLRRDLAESEKSYVANFERYVKQRDRVLNEIGMNMSMRGPLSFVSDELVSMYPCPLEERFGLWGEGGKWVCMRHKQYRSTSNTVVVSIGSFGDFSFESDIYSHTKAEIYTFDPFHRMNAKQQKQYPFVNFFPIGLTGEDQVPALKRRHKVDFTSVKGVLQTINRTYVDVFKIDCEGCEYKVVKDLETKWTRDNQPFGQIQMEIHGVMDNAAGATEPLMQSLFNSGYRLFHVEVNGWCASCFEIALIHENLVAPHLIYS